MMGSYGRNKAKNVLKQGFMVKRSQNKNRFTPINYKLRWFVLTDTYLTYYESNSETSKEKGQILLKQITVIEKAVISIPFSAEINNGSFPVNWNNKPISVPESSKSSSRDCITYQLQIGYKFESRHSSKCQEYILYLFSYDREDRDSWISALKSVCVNNANKSRRFHPSLWDGKKWQCCKVNQRVSSGCELTGEWTQPCNPRDSTASSRSTPTEPYTGSLDDFEAESISMASSRSREIPTRPKIVIALYPFQGIEAGDLSLEKGCEYEVLDDSQEHWWKAKDPDGVVGYIPSNYVKEKENIGLQKYEWFVGDMSRQRAESLLKQEDKEGCFVVRNSSTKGLYTLSLFTKVPHAHIKHYHIKQNSKGEFYLSEKHCCPTIAELVNYHKHNSGGLASRLRITPCDRPVPATAGLSHDKWEIDAAELMLLEELGSGQFGVVRRGRWRGSIDVAVKMMKEGTMSEDDFIEEAKVMTKLQHPNLVQLYGVCSKHRPIYIVTEYMRHGSLLNFLRRHEVNLITNIGLLLDLCIQVCKGMSYLERHNYIHRDLAARNCLVASENVVKVADFGLARYVLDDQYTSSGGTKFPIKWASPEVLNYTRFSSKSDIWAYGVLMWEIFSCGKMPYGRLKNTEVVERVQRGIILERPKSCYKEAYDVMKKCWAHQPEDRPTFRILKDQLVDLVQGLPAD